MCAAAVVVTAGAGRDDAMFVPIVSDDEALRALFEARYSAMVGLARLILGDRESAEDAVQETFAKLQGRLDRVDDPSAYLHSMVVNRCRGMLRRRQVMQRYLRGARPRVEERDPAQGAADRNTVAAALQLLPIRQRECLVLRYYLDYNEAQIAGALQISPGSVKTHMRRGLQAMEHILGSDHGRS